MNAGIATISRIKQLADLPLADITNLAAEAGLLGAMMVNPSVIDFTADRIKPTDFAVGLHCVATTTMAG